MSQKSVLIAFAIAIVLMMSLEAEAKRIGCASFGHSCYGGHGKRSDTSAALQEIDAPSAEQQPPMPIIRILQRRIPYQPELNGNEIPDHEKQMKLMILGVLGDVISEAYRKSTAADLDSSA